MNGRGLRVVRRAARYLQSFGVNTAAVLLYHRVAEPPTDPQLLAVTHEHFAGHLDVIRRHATPLSLAELGRAIHARRIPDRAVAITFDDGYWDNVGNALPLLQRFEIPATMYIATANMDGRAELYWDELEQILLQPGDMPASITMEIKGRAHGWQLGDAVVYSPADAQRNRNWTVQDAAPTARQQIYRDLCGLLRPLPQAERDGALKSLKAQIGVHTTVRPLYRVMTSDELRRMAECSLVEVGAHTVTHPVLAAQPQEVQRDELSSSKLTLERVTGRSVTSFAYPFGTRADYNETTIALASQVGFQLCCANTPESVRVNTDRLQIPRFLVRNWDQRTFAKAFAAMFRV